MSSPIDRKRLGELLHQRLLSGDRTATAEIVEAFLPPLVSGLRRRFPRAGDDHLVQTAAHDALINLFEHPTKFDPARGELFTYLRLRACGYLLNSLRSKKEEANKVVELDDARAVYDAGEDAEDALISREFRAGVIERLRQVFTAATDLRVLALMIEGERETGSFAEALGATDRPPEEQRKLVKQVKDRIIKTLERKFGRKKRRES